MVGRVQLFARDPARPTAVELWELNHGFQQELRVQRMNYGATANLMVPRALLDAVGPFDPALCSSGDKEWGIRATAAGYPPHYADDVVVRHPARATWRELRGKYLRIAADKNDLRLLDHAIPRGNGDARGLLRSGGQFARHRWAEARDLDRRDRLRYFAAMLFVVGMRKYDTARPTIRPREVR